MDKLLELESCDLGELHIEINPEYNYDENRPLPAPAVDFEAFIHQTETNRFAVSLGIKSEPGPEYPLKFSARIVGFFTVAEPFADGKLRAERVVNGLTILYGMVRGYIFTSTSWFPGKIMLPTVYFTDLVKAKVESARSRATVEPEQEQEPDAAAAGG